MLFLFGIGLPSILLGYLALRGIQNDLALLEKSQTQENRIIGEEIVRLLEEKIENVESEFLVTISNKLQSDEELLGSLSRLKAKYSVIQEVFQLYPNGRISFPVASLSFLPGDSMELIANPNQPEALQRAERLEFQEKLYVEAAASYQEILSVTQDAESQGELLLAIARTQAKAGNIPAALNSYSSLADNYSENTTSRGIPLDLIARYEIGRLHSIPEDPNEALQWHNNLLEDIINGKWLLRESQYKFYVNQIKGSLESITATPAISVADLSKCKELIDQERRKVAYTERLYALESDSGDSLLALVLEEKSGSGDQMTRHYLERPQGYGYLAFIHMEVNGSDPGYWGFLLDEDQFKERFLQPTVSSQELREGLDWAVRDRNDNIVMASSQQVTGIADIRLSFIGNFPPWILEIYQDNPRILESLMSSSRGIYLYMFILLAGILAFGLVFTVRIVSKEVELVRMQTDFVSTVSHEFRSPLTSIRQLSEMLQSDRVATEDRRKRYYDILVEQSERLSLLVENILGFASMEQGSQTLDIQPVEVAAFLEEIVTHLRNQVRHEAFTINLDCQEGLPPVPLDKDAMTQAISNLLDNAIKYSGDSRTVDIIAKANEYQFSINVQDYGYGIEDKELGKIFDRFYRGGDAQTMGVKGSGLGLTLVRQIVEAHHGRIEVLSTPGSGSTFSIRIPIDSREVGS